MRFEIRFSSTAAAHLRAYRKDEQKSVLGGVETQLAHEPNIESRHRKRLGANEVSDWELRVGDDRICYGVAVEDEPPVVKLKAVGHKSHNALSIGVHEVDL
jgi:mRNA-degrading endonuclease RelE of RelBE toxin-antitoxin system